MRDRMIMYGDDDDEGDEIAVIQKKLLSCRKNRMIYTFNPSFEGQSKSEMDHDGKPLYEFGIVERRCIACCDGRSYDYYRYIDNEGNKEGLLTAKEQCGSCMFNMKVSKFGTDEIVGQVGDSKFFEFTKSSFAITVAKGADAAGIVALGVAVDDIREDVARENSRR